MPAPPTFMGAMAEDMEPDAMPEMFEIVVDEGDTTEELPATETDEEPGGVATGAEEWAAEEVAEEVDEDGNAREGVVRGVRGWEVTPSRVWAR